MDDILLMALEDINLVTYVMLGSCCRSKNTEHDGRGGSELAVVGVILCFAYDNVICM